MTEEMQLEQKSKFPQAAKSFWKGSHLTTPRALMFRAGGKRTRESRVFSGKDIDLNANPGSV